MSQLEAIDISRITYELIRLHQDRISMSYEDKLSSTFQHIEKLEKINQDGKNHIETLSRKYEDLCHKLLEKETRTIVSKENGQKEQHEEVKVLESNNLIENSIKPFHPNLLSESSKEKKTRTDSWIHRKSNDEKVNDSIPIRRSLPCEPNNHNSISSNVPVRTVSLHANSNIKDTNSVSKPTIQPDGRTATMLFDLDSSNSRYIVNESVKYSSLDRYSNLESNHPVQESPQQKDEREWSEDQENKLNRPIERPSKIRCVEVIRNGEERQALPGFTCDQCQKYYETMIYQGMITEENKAEMLQACSRHKARWTPPCTPDGYWDVDFETPKDWQS